MRNIELELPEKYENLTMNEMESIIGGEKKDYDQLAEWLYKLLGKK